MALPNIYHHRRVADSSAKPCIICYKSSSSVLITPDNRDFFYICAGHLKDRGFAQPLGGQSEEEAKKKQRQEELDREIELVKKEWEEKQKARKDKSKKKDKDKSKDKDAKKDAKDEADDETAAEKEKDEKIKSLEEKKGENVTSDEPRVFALQKSIYQTRVQKLHNAQMAKRYQERLRDPSSFPSVPSGNP